MEFTRRTYRVAIRRSARTEKFLRGMAKRSENVDLWIVYTQKLLTQIEHTRKLQARKRRNRK